MPAPALQKLEEKNMVTQQLNNQQIHWSRVNTATVAVKIPH